MVYRKSQSSIEFVILVGFILFFFVIFLLIIQENLSVKKYQSQSFEIKELALNIQNELNLALEASEGYQRQFRIPAQIAGLDYEVNITQGMVYIRTQNQKHALALPVPDSVGDVSKGVNIIKKQNGMIRINI
jgi:hypothetical protein